LRISLSILFIFFLSALQGVAAQPLPDSFFGMNILHAIHKTPWPSVPIATIRLWDSDNTRWSALAPARDKYNFDGLDNWLALATRHKATVLYTFGRVPAWTNGNAHQSVAPKDLNDWDSFVRALVKHSAHNISAYELWNEPNQPNCWSGDTKTLVEMAQRAYHIIKAEQPNAIVTTPSPTWTETSTPSQWFDQYFAAGGGRFADVIAFHGYVGTSPEALTSELEKIRDVAQKYGLGDKPIWDTESGWGIDAKLSDPHAQAAFLARSYILHVSQGVHRFYWYAWDGSDGGSSPPAQSWGTLWDRSGDREPAQALKIVTAWLRNAQLPLICSTSGTVWQCKLNGSDLLLWDSAAEHDFSLDSNYARYTDLTGHMHDVPGDKRIKIGPSPIKLEMK
jgi:polysaccharide biosynthesis protein PslG